MTIKEILNAIIQDVLSSSIFFISIGIVISLVLFLLFLKRELVLSRKLKKKIFLTGATSDEAKPLKDLLEESIFEYTDESGDLNSIDNIQPDKCLLIGLVYSGFEEEMNRILDVARNNRLPLIVYCKGCRLEGDFKDKLHGYRWFDMCKTPYRFVSISLAAITANNHKPLSTLINKLWKKIN